MMIFLSCFVFPSRGSSYVQMITDFTKEINRLDREWILNNFPVKIFMFFSASEAGFALFFIKVQRFSAVGPIYTYMEKIIKYFFGCSLTTEKERFIIIFKHSKHSIHIG